MIHVDCNIVVTCWERADLFALLYVMFSCAFVSSQYGVLGVLLGKGRPLRCFVCDVFLCFCLFLIWCPGSGVSIPDLCLLSYFGINGDLWVYLQFCDCDIA